MRRIAICDDEPAQAELLRSFVQDWARDRREPSEVRLFPSGDAFWFVWENEKDWDVLLLDIQMSGTDGLKLCRMLRDSGSRLPVVFVTGLAGHMGEGFELDAVHYLIKPVSRDKIFLCLDKAIQRGGREPFILLECTDGQTARVLLSNIALLESSGHRTVVTLAGGDTLESKAGFRELCGRLPEGDFIQCHRCCLVGLRHVYRVQRDSLILDGGRQVPVSRGRFQQVNSAFVSFYRQEG
ncbi:LytR/AlgR family response regulator transcription factor [Acutalibacter sp. 1XD8-36]|uniref:LytR/AlgR family response regulator transcription factor n=1 Tax=Acutalibacter sp. 1XD8-36 TaxID=2320852 RepID=UPI002635D544|nr:LytTR family DNA-binding domain-containing protein [Acutalibacter sp. 1XD8-36]